MKILLIYTNRFEDPVCYPLGLAYVFSGLKKTDNEIEVLDLSFTDDYQKILADKLANFDPDVIGLSIRNIDNQSMKYPIFFLSDVKEIIKICKNFSNSKIVLGGAAFNVAPFDILEYTDTDLGIFGEGEIIFNELVNRLKKKEDYLSLPGIISRKNGRIIFNDPVFIDPLDRIGLPDRDIFDIDYYIKKASKMGYIDVINIQSKRGCPMNCIYCSYPFIDGKKVRLRSPKNVVNELAYIKRNYDINNVYFVDGLFNYPIWHTESICMEIINRNLEIEWGCDLNPRFVSKNMINLMKKSGCTHVGIGNESGSDTMLKNLKKGFSTNDIVESCIYLKEEDIYTMCFLMFGGPGEDEKTIKESVSLMEKIKPDLVHAQIGIRVYPGCEIADIGIKEGYIPQDTNLLCPTFYLSDKIKDWIYEYLTDISNNNQRWTLNL